jgi:hypothetical protein
VAAEGGRVGAIAQCSIDCFEHTRKIAIDFAVPESQDAETRFAEHFIAVRILPAMNIEIVLSTIDLDSETMLEANKIHDETLARRLSTEMVTAVSPRAEMNPYLDLLWGQRFAQTSRDLVRHMRLLQSAPTRRALRATLPLRGRD